MLGSLRARLFVSFAVVVALAVFLAGAGALFLLRERQQESARERYGRHAEPINDRIATTLALGGTLDEVKAVVADRAATLDLRIILIDDDLLVVFDSENEIQGDYILIFETPKPVIDENGSRYKYGHYDDADLTLFAPPAPPATGDFAAPAYQAFVAIPESQLSTAWLDLAPRLALAGAIALAVSFAVAYFISRSISGPLGRITAASKQMAAGNYDVHIPIRGQDEVGKLSEAFNYMAREVSTSQRTMKDLLANVSHELKTPLTSIQGFSQAMLDGAVVDEEQFRESVGIINEEANRMRGLVDDLLLLSQIESGQMTMEHKHVDMASLLERTIERFQWTLRDAGLHYALSAGALPDIHGDERRLEQVFGNLMENAVRHTPPGGRITLTATAKRGGAVTIGVHNTGSYIPPEDLPRVFERFFQVDRARTRKGGSSGLGLAIVTQIVEAHGGSVHAESAKSSGTEFIVSLPSATTDARNGRVPATDAAKPKRASKKREAPA